MSDPVISAVLPVHAGADAAHFAVALKSLGDQTIRPDELIVVEDGPLLPAHHDVLDQFSEACSGLRRVCLAENRGAGVANQAGLLAAGGTWILKADADDINLAHRLEAQRGAVLAGDVDVCGAAMAEFEGSPERIVSLRRMPAEHRSIARRMRWNNPINHPTAMYRRELAIAVGGYPPWRYMQDYGLFARMIAGGARMMNLAEPLVLFRTGSAVMARRREGEFNALEWELQTLLHEAGLVGRVRMCTNVTARLTYRHLPTWAMTNLQTRVLSRRNRVEGVPREDHR